MSQAPSGAWSAKPSLPPSESVLTGLWERTISGPCRCQVSAPIPRPGRATELDLCEGQRGGQWPAVSGVRGHSGTHGRSTAVSFLRGRGRSHGHTGTHGREARAVQSTPCCRALAPSAPPGSPHRSREQRWTHVLGKRHKRQLLELFTPNQQTNAALSVGARRPVPASEHGGCLPSNARGRESQARPSGNEGPPFLGPWSLREDGRRERSRIHRTPLAVSRSEAAPLWATSPLPSRGQPSNYGHTPRPL